MENKEKPTWLQILEAESWQAEMLISGAAIYGSLQLPGLIKGLIDKALLLFPEDVLEISYFIFWYLIICSSTLIVSFLLHFVLRAIWIGMIGLVSVFPKGISRDSEYHSPHFMDQLLKEFPDVNGFNQKLDNFCSMIFGSGFGLVMVMVSLSLTLSVGLLFAFLLAMFLPFSTYSIFLIYLLLVFTPAIFSMILNSKRMRNKEWVKKIHFKFSIKFYGRMVYNLFYEPIYYILYIFLTNFKSRQVGLLSFVYFFLIMGISMPTLLGSNAFLLRKEVFLSMAETDHRVFPENYEDQLQTGEAIFVPMIPSDVIKGGVLKVFLPMSRREKVLVNEYCGAYKEEENLSRLENNRRRRDYYKDCRAKYYTIFVNDILYDDLEFFRHTHTNAGEEGLLTYIPSDGFKEGVNQLRIVHLYTDGKGQKKESLVPFWFDKNGE